MTPTSATRSSISTFFYKNGLGYANEMGLRSQTLYALEDSPIGLAAWMLDHDDAELRAHRARLRRTEGGPHQGRHPRQRDAVLAHEDGHLVGAALLEYAAASGPGGFFDARGVQLPVAVTVFPQEIYAAPKSWAERAYPKLLYYERAAKGTHFAAWEQPEEFVTMQRAAFRSLR